MHEPLLVPFGFQCACCDLCKQAKDMPITKRGKPFLGGITQIRVAWVERTAHPRRSIRGRRCSETHYDRCSMKVVLIAFVLSHVVGQVAHIAYVSGRRI